MTTIQLIAWLEARTAFSRSALYQTSRALGFAGMMPRVPPGRSQGACLTVEDVAWFLIGLAVGGPVAGCAPVAAEWGAMRPVDGATGFPTFGAALAAILADVTGALRVNEVCVAADHPAARIVVAGVSGRHFGHHFPAIGRQFVITGDVLRELAAVLASPMALPALHTPPGGGRESTGPREAGSAVEHDEQGTEPPNPFINRYEDCLA